MAQRSRSSAWLFYLILGLILLALPVGYFYFLGEEAPPAPPPDETAAESDEALELKLGIVAGPVEIRRGGGDWSAARVGDALRASDAVRTGDGATATLVGGDEYEVKMESGTEVAVDALTRSISRVLLGNGMATAQVKGTGRHTFEVKAEGSDALARTRGGTFTINNNATGTVAVGTREGDVEFTGQGKVVIVRAGQQSIVRPGQGPSDPAPIPSSLLLKVRWPTTRELAKKKLVLAGQVEPGARVEVGGRAVKVDDSGKFAHTLTLNEGKNALTVRAKSVGGAEEESQRQVEVDTTPPSMGVDKDLWR